MDRGSVPRGQEISRIDHFIAYPLGVDRRDVLVSVFGGGDGRGDCGWRRCMW
jgi:hypothetical protein